MSCRCQKCVKACQPKHCENVLNGPKHVKFNLSCPNDVKKLCDISACLCPPTPQPFQRAVGVLDFGGNLSNLSGINFNLLVPWNHGSVIQTISVPNLTSTATGVELLIPGASGTQKTIQNLRLLPQTSLNGITFILRVNNVVTNLKVSTTNLVSTGSVTVTSGDTVSVVADLTGIPPTSLLGFATVTMEIS